MRLAQAGKINLITDAEVKELDGKEKLEKIVIKHKQKGMISVDTD
jgi:thioredoxin reductase (NADPH)